MLQMWVIKNTQCSRLTLAISLKNITQSCFTFSKTSNKSLWKNVFWYVKVYILSKFIKCTIYWDEKQMLEKFPWDKMNVTKNAPVFFVELRLIKLLLLICGSYASWSTRFISLKMCVGFSIFDPVSFLVKSLFLFNKKHGLRL